MSEFLGLRSAIGNIGVFPQDLLAQPLAHQEIPAPGRMNLGLEPAISRLFIHPLHSCDIPWPAMTSFLVRVGARAWPSSCDRAWGGSTVKSRP